MSPTPCRYGRSLDPRAPQARRCADLATCRIVLGAGAARAARAALHEGRDPGPGRCARHPRRPGDRVPVPPRGHRRHRCSRTEPVGRPRPGIGRGLVTHRTRRDPHPDHPGQREERGRPRRLVLRQTSLRREHRRRSPAARRKPCRAPTTRTGSRSRSPRSNPARPTTSPRPPRPPRPRLAARPGRPRLRRRRHRLPPRDQQTEPRPGDEDAEPVPNRSAIHLRTRQRPPQRRLAVPPPRHLLPKTPHPHHPRQPTSPNPGEKISLSTCRNSRRGVPGLQFMTLSAPYVSVPGPNCSG